MTPIARPGAAAVNPYPGLRPFREDEEHLFFGREHQVDGMVDKLARTHFLVVVGTSGSGKSSLVNCGLRPALHRGLLAGAGTQWRVAQFRPGNRPLHALADALASLAAPTPARAGPSPFSTSDLIEATLRSSKLGLLDAIEQAGLAPHTNVLVVADQFEELFRYRDLATTAARGDPGATEDTTALVNLLLEVPNQAAPNVFVVLTMRSDFLGDCAQYFGLPEAINAGQYLVPRLSREERRLAIAGPAAVSGAQVSPVLLTRLVNDVGDNPDQLSILQHALNRTWARWHAQGAPAQPMTLEHYEKIGAMAKALDAHAEEAFTELGVGRHPLCELVFKALTDRSTDARGVRRPTRFDDLCAITAAPAPEVSAVLDAFRQPGRGFVMPPAGEPLSPDTVIDISHESLMRVWERLRQWADEESQSVKTYQRLATDAELYAQQQEGLLWDPALQTALDWRKAARPNAAWAARYHAGFDAAMKFLDDSRAQQQRERAQARSKRLRRRAVVALTTLSAIGVAVVMWRLADERDHERSVALSSRLSAQAQAHGAAGRTDRALLVAVAAMHTQPTQDAQDTLLALIQDAPRRMLHGHQSGVAALAFSPDGVHLASAGLDGSVRLWDTAAGRPLRTWSTGASGTPSLAFTNDGRWLSAGSWVENGGIRWDLSNDARPPAPDGPAQPVLGGALHAERGLFAGVRDGEAGASRITLWDIARRAELVTLPGHAGPISHLAFSPDGRVLASTDGEGQVRLWQIDTDPARSHLLASLTAHAGRVERIAFSPDSQTLATIGRDGKVQLLPVAAGPGLRTLATLADVSDGDSMTLAQFAPDGRTFAVAAGGRAIGLWDVASGQRRHLIKAQQGELRSIAFSRDGKRLASAGDDGSVLLWHTVDGRRIGAALKAHTGPVRALAFSGDGRHLASAGSDGVVSLWDVSPDKPLRGELRAGLESMTGVAFSPDGRKLAFVSEDSSVTIWRPADGPDIFLELHGQQTEPLTGLAFSPDGRLLATTSWDGSIAFWNTEQGKPAAELLRTSDGTVTSVAFRPPDGRWLASASLDGKVVLWEVASGRRLGVLEHADGIRSVAFSPDGAMLAAAGQDHSITLWAFDGGTRPARVEPPLTGHEHQVTSVKFSSDGTRLVSGSLDKTVRVWDAATRRPVGAPLRHPGGVLGIALSPDGRSLAAGVAKGSVMLWDLADRQAPPLALAGHAAHANSVAFAPDGHTLASASADFTLRLWDTNARNAQRSACAIANRNLNRSEWPKYLDPSELPKKLAAVMTDTPLCEQFPLGTE